MLKVAILYQSKIAPEVDGVIKPMKEGGYSDSGADIAFALKQANTEVITPVISPTIKNNFDWVFPDSEKGIRSAIEKGANLFWLNTVLYSEHSILKFLNKNFLVVGQAPHIVEIFDDKFYTNNLLRRYQVPVALSFLLTPDNYKKSTAEFPVVLKPVRGRGSQGVFVVKNEKELEKGVLELFSSKKYGMKIIVEEFLPEKEITITIMPPGNYKLNNKVVNKKSTGVYRLLRGSIILTELHHITELLQ